MGNYASILCVALALGSVGAIAAPLPPPSADGLAQGAAPPPPGGGPHHPPPPPPPRAAHFRFERGDGVIDIKCADDEPMKACVDAALQLIDRLRPERP